MRFTISLDLPNKTNNTLPINYQYEFSSWIYHTIHNIDPVFSQWLHKEGYSTGAQRFKLFTFSHLEIPHGGFRIEGDRLKITAESCRIQISFLIGEAAMPFITGIFQNQEFTIGDTVSRVLFRVNSVERLADPVFESQMTFNTLSPIVVGKSRLAEGGKGTAFLSPEDKDFERLFFQNLGRKVAVVQPENVISPEQYQDLKLELLNKSRSKVIQVKTATSQTTFVKGYLFRFRINAPPEWIKVGYFSGFGEKNGMGMGCVIKN